MFLNLQFVQENNVLELDTTGTIDLWLRFSNIDDERVKLKLKTIVGLLVQFNTADIINDYLLDVYKNNSELKCEATFILNNLFLGKHSA